MTHAAGHGWAYRAPVVARWALRDLAHERGLSLLAVLLVLCLITPAMVVAMARVAVIAGWTEMLETDPRNRAVIIIGEYDVTSELLAQIASWPETGFVVPEPSTFTGSTRLQPPLGPPTRIDTRTSAPGDPILGELAAPDNDQIVLTERAAQRLGVEVGTTLRVMLRREPTDTPVEFTEIEFQLTGIVAESRWPDELAFLSPARAAGIDRWIARPGDPQPPLLSPGDPTRWRSLRVHAKAVGLSLDLRDRLDAAGFETRLNTDQVIRMVTLSTGLQALATSLVVLCAAGFVVAVFLLQRLAVERKAEALALMSVAGLSRREMALFLVIQAGVVTVAGVGLAGLALIPLRDLIERLAAALVPGVPPAQTDLGLFLIGGSGAVVLSLVFSLAAARGIARLNFPMLLRND